MRVYQIVREQRTQIFDELPPNVLDALETQDTTDFVKINRIITTNKVLGHFGNPYIILPRVQRAPNVKKLIAHIIDRFKLERDWEDSGFIQGYVEEKRDPAWLVYRSNELTVILYYYRFINHQAEWRARFDIILKAHSEPFYRLMRDAFGRGFLSENPIDLTPDEIDDILEILNQWQTGEEP